MNTGQANDGSLLPVALRGAGMGQDLHPVAPAALADEQAAGAEATSAAARPERPPLQWARQLAGLLAGLGGSVVRKGRMLARVSGGGDLVVTVVLLGVGLWVLLWSAQWWAKAGDGLAFSEGFEGLLICGAAVLVRRFGTSRWPNEMQRGIAANAGEPLPSFSPAVGLATLILGVTLAGFAWGIVVRIGL